MTSDGVVTRWFDWDPERLRRDIDEIAAIAPNLAHPAWDEQSLANGGWVGTLPLWPFERAAPPNLEALLPRAMSVIIAYPSAYPMLPPIVYPTNPQPALEEVSDTVWHVAPGGSLCLFQSEGMWDPAASIEDIVLKSSGWRIEYELMHRGSIDRMTERGIVTDTRLDELITEQASQAASE